MAKIKIGCNEDYEDDCIKVTSNNVTDDYLERYTKVCIGRNKTLPSLEFILNTEIGLCMQGANLIMERFAPSYEFVLINWDKFKEGDIVHFDYSYITKIKPFIQMIEQGEFVNFNWNNKTVSIKYDGQTYDISEKACYYIL